MALIPLEDGFHDIIGKAQRGLGLNDAALARLAGVSAEAVAGVRSGNPEEATLRKLAEPLQLGEEALIESARESWYPEAPDVAGVAQFNTPFGDMAVNAYVIWDPETRQAAIFDTGTDSAGMIQFVQEHGLSVQAVYLTHAHGDHIADLDRLIHATGAPAYSHSQEPVPETERFSAGHHFQIGRLTVETRATSGHSKGGMTYVIQGLERPVAVVGDALFAGSIGGGMVSYQDALANNRQKILSLPDETLVCPGHGPLTTVGQEKQHNPFFPELRGINE